MGMAPQGTFTVETWGADVSAPEFCERLDPLVAVTGERLRASPRDVESGRLR